MVQAPVRKVSWGIRFVLRFLFRGRLLKNPICLLAALSSLAAGASLAWHHPLWPVAACLLFGLWCLLAAWRPGLWLFVVPACLPFLNFSPWTGWIVFEEFDILLLGALAGGYGRLACSSRTDGGEKMPGSLVVLMALLGSSGLLSLFRGFADAGGFAFDWFAGYADALNSVRVFKSLAFALFFVPLLQQEIGGPRALASRRLASGMVVGMTVVTLAVLWERAAFPGLLNFATHYRTVALFWEMHVGGAAIDAYLALTTPFVAWLVLSTRRRVPWTAAAALALLCAYACLTTFARGVYFSVAGSLVLLGILLWAQQTDFNAWAYLASLWRRHSPERWRTHAGLLLILALAVEVAAVMTGASFMTQRLASTERDLGGRAEHWRHGLGLLQSPEEWLLGKGLGRLPANYASHVSQGEFPGGVTLHGEPEPIPRVNAFVAIRGPASRGDLGGLFALTQRVTPRSGGRHRVSLDIRVQTKTDVYLALCERHLLYDGDCQVAFIRVLPVKTAWQTLVVSLGGPVLAGGPGYAPRLGVFSLSVVNAGGVADLDNVRLIGPQREELLGNGNFFHGMTQWFPAAQSYFLPWHIDNLYLETLIERGVLGFLIFTALMAYTLWHLVYGRARSGAMSPYLAASLSAVLLVGLASSVMDVPRVAFLLYLLTFFSIQVVRRKPAFVNTQA
jgi:hypothetical protein